MTATGRVRPFGLRGLRWVVILATCAAGLWWNGSRLAPSSVSRGVAAYNRGDWNEAFRLAQHRLGTAKDDPTALRLLARASARLGRFPQARSMYDRLGAQDREAEDDFLLGLGLSLSNDYREAQRLLKRALDTDPDHAEALHLFAVVAFVKVQRMDAAWAAERLARRPGWEARGELLLGVVRASDNDPAGAVVALRGALKRDPTARSTPWDPLSTQKLLARSLLQTGQSAEARDVLRGAMSTPPEPEASWLLSRAFLQERNGVEAAASLARSGSYRAAHPLDPEPSPYVGEARCAECHRDVRKAVVTSRHAMTFARSHDLARLPLPNRPLTDPDNPRVTHALEWNGGQLQVETHAQGKVLRAVVDYALGSSDRYTSLVGRDDHGQIRTLRLSYYHGVQGSGWDRTKNQKRVPERVDEFLGEPFASVQAAYECLICHTTSPRAAWAHTGPVADDRAIGCEQCHGPGGLHLAAIAIGFADPAIAMPAQASPAEINRLCSVCHSQHFAETVMLASRTSRDWARFPSSTLPWSRCYIESGGTLSCVTCHDPHKNAETAPAYYEAKCLSCHAAPVDSRHAAPDPPQRADLAFRSPCPVNPSRDCLNCHMPKVRHDWLHGSFTDHYIRVQGDSTAGPRAAIAQ
jgi:tetratricopeptide (TPR) repeat protein